MKNTFVLNLDEEVVAFLDQKIQATGDDANAYLNRILEAEQKRQQQSHRGGSGQRNTSPEYPQNLPGRRTNTPDADSRNEEVRQFIQQGNKSPDDFE